MLIMGGFANDWRYGWVRLRPRVKKYGFYGLGCFV